MRGDVQRVDKGRETIPRRIKNWNTLNFLLEELLERLRDFGISGDADELLGVQERLDLSQLQILFRRRHYM